MNLHEILVVVPHSGILIPREIFVSSLSSDFPRLMRNVDWHTNWLYDFHDILGNSCLIFPYCSLVLEANRNPDNLDSSVPLKDIWDEPVYKPGLEPDKKLRQSLAKKYLTSFHQSIRKEIMLGKTFMLDAHSTVTAKGVADNQIELMNYQISQVDERKTQFCPDIFIETYAEILANKLPGIRVSVNESKYHNVYGHVCGEHSINAMNRVGNRVPAILQETNQNLYINSDQTPDLAAIETLRRAFAESLSEMLETIRNK